MKRSSPMTVLLGIITIAIATIAAAAAAAQDPAPSPPSTAKGELSDPLAILKRADQNTKKVKAVSYKAKVTVTGFLAGFQPGAEGTVILAGEKTRTGLGMFLADATVRMPGSEGATHVTAGSNAKTTFVIDFEHKIAHEDTDPQVLGRLGASAASIVMREFIHPTPFDDEINGEKLVLKDGAKVGNEDCYVIDVVYSGGRGRAVWYFSRKDFLPRRVNRIIDNPTGDGSAEFQLALTDLKVNPKLDEGTFTLKLPDGFKKSNEVAP